MLTFPIIMLLIVLSALGGLQIFSLLRINQLNRALAESATRQEMLLRSSGNAILKMNRVMQSVERRVALTARRQQELETRSAGSLTYEQATRLIQMGAAPEDLVKTCGLSQAEAKLVSLMVARGAGSPS